MVREGQSVEAACLILRVSRSGYYAWLNRPQSARESQNQKLVAEMKKIFDESRDTYGSPRIFEKLKAIGKRVGKNRVARLMQKEGIKAVPKRRFKIVTTDSNHSLPIASRVFKTEEVTTHPVAPNEVWASDISYIHTNEGVLYLCTYLDLFTRKVVGFATDVRMQTGLLTAALEMAFLRQGLSEENNLLTHSDRGSQYASVEYSEALSKFKITASMSRKGNCYDNAFAESFFATIKKELIYRTNYKTKEEAKRAIFEYIEVWYNRERLHSSLGYKSPIQFEESLAA